MQKSPFLVKGRGISEKWKFPAKVDRGRVEGRFIHALSTRAIKQTSHSCHFHRAWSSLGGQGLQITVRIRYKSTALLGRKKCLINDATELAATVIVRLCEDLT